MINYTCGTKPVSQAGKIARSGSQSQREIRFILPAHGASHIIIILFFCRYRSKLFKELVVRKDRRHVVIGQNITRPSPFAAGFTFERLYSTKGVATKQI